MESDILKKSETRNMHEISVNGACSTALHHPGFFKNPLFIAEIPFLSGTKLRL
jgi:hypothetical protein